MTTTSPQAQADPGVPIVVDWIESDQLRDGAPGRLGLTHLPGKHGSSVRYPRLVYRRNLDDDLAVLVEAGVTYLLLLVDDRELRTWGDADIVSRAAEAGIEVRRHPIADGTPPGDPREMGELVADLRTARASGNAAVACMGGVGRTGTVAACALVEAGLSATAAIEEVRRIRHPYAVETRAQRRFVERYEAWVRRR